MDKITFKIEDKEFSVSSDLINADSFEVKSVPRPYPVIWDEQEKPYDIINKVMSKNANNILFIDDNVYKIYDQYLQAPKSKIFSAEATEDFKSLNGVVSLVEFLQKNQFTKGETLVVVGGGIVQDIGAFVGACYKRGIPWTYIPTTLLSMCDSCIGGKAGINHNNAKNQLALFSAPSQVIINPVFLKTLNHRDIKAGLGEILKLHITGGKKFLEGYVRHIRNATALNYGAYKPLILGALNVKKVVIEVDEFELSYRKGLNYGHTLGHAIEVLSNYHIPHGQAVVIGMIIVNELSNRRSMLSDVEKALLNKLLFELLEPDIMHGISTLELGDLIKKDKKTSGGIVTFIILQSIGDMRFLSVNLDSLLMEQISQIIKETFNSI